MLHLLPRWHRFDWNRFTDRARWVIGAAQHSAYADQNPAIEVQHLIQAVNMVQADLYRPSDVHTVQTVTPESKPFSPEARTVLTLAWNKKNRCWSRHLHMAHIDAALREYLSKK
jgi:hypothetical protein